MIISVGFLVELCVLVHVGWMDHRSHNYGHCRFDLP